MRLFVGFGLIILLSSCATTTNNYYTETAATWRGGNINTLVRHWGAPYEKVTNSDGSSLYLYKSTSYRTYTPTTAPQVGVHLAGEKPLIVMPNDPLNTGNRGMSLTCYTVFLVDKKGVIQSVKNQGTCYGSENFMQKKRNPG